MSNIFVNALVGLHLLVYTWRCDQALYNSRIISANYSVNPLFYICIVEFTSKSPRRRSFRFSSWIRFAKFHAISLLKAITPHVLAHNGFYHICTRISYNGYVSFHFNQFPIAVSYHLLNNVIYHKL